MAASAKDIGSKYGESLQNFQTDLSSGIDKIYLDWANTSIQIMRGIITRKARTRQASTLASDLVAKPIANGIQIVTMQDYWDFVNQGVKGVFNKSKAPRSEYQFRNLGVSPDMLKSFKEYIARTGSKGLKKQTLIRKNKKKQDDIINKEAMQMAVATKIGGIKPMNYVEPAVGAKRLKVLNRALSKEIGTKIKLAIIQ
jgi:hypothetical protein